jgi:hypothetical protein
MNVVKNLGEVRDRKLTDRGQVCAQDANADYAEFPARFRQFADFAQNSRNANCIREFDVFEQ